MIPEIYNTLFPMYPRLREGLVVGDEVSIAAFGTERLFAAPPAKAEKAYIYLLEGVEVEFLYPIFLDPAAYLWQLNCNANAPQGRRAQVIWTNRRATDYDHHWGLRFEGNHEILLRAIQIGQKARIITLPIGYKEKPKR